MSVLAVDYFDARHRIGGYLVIDSLVRGVAAGGVRIRRGIGKEETALLAANMTHKQAAVGIDVGGAKAGLDIAPDYPFRFEVLCNFFQTLKPLLLDCFSCGPDMNTTMHELESAASYVGIPSLKLAVARSRDLSTADFLRRYALFQQKSRGGTVNELRAGAAVSAVTKVLLEELGIDPGGSTVAIQGAGTLGRATARLLTATGVRVVAWADDQKCLTAADETDRLLPEIENGRLPSYQQGRCSRSVLTSTCDVLVLAATSRAFGVDQIAGLGCRGVVVAANLGLDPEVEEALFGSGVLVVPDLVAGVGGSLAVEALYDSDPIDASAVLEHVERRASAVASETLRQSLMCGRSPRAILMRRVQDRLERRQALEDRRPLLFPSALSFDTISAGCGDSQVEDRSG